MNMVKGEVVIMGLKKLGILGVFFAFLSLPACSSQNDKENASKEISIHLNQELELTAGQENWVQLDLEMLLTS